MSDTTTDMASDDRMSALLPDVDPDGLLEFSVVYTDRSLNHMSASFQSVMTDISRTLKSVYHAHSVALVPGGGTYAMEAVARQFAGGEHALIVRNGWFSFRWTQILDAGGFANSSTVITAQPVDDSPTPAFAPPPIDDVTATIAAEKPAVVFAPHVETSAGMILPDDYIAALASATHDVGGIFVLDCIASGTIWVNMEALGVDALISAPQKGWSGPPCAGLVMMSERARARVAETTGSSFAVNLGTWVGIMETYENGGHAYHATMPTDALRQFRDIMAETEAYGFEKIKADQIALGERVRAAMSSRGIKSVAADGFGAPGVVVSYTDDPNIKNGSAFASVGVQIAGGVPLRVGEPEDFSTFRIGLFGLDKLQDVDRSVESFELALEAVFSG